MSRMELRLPRLNDELVGRLYNWKFSQALGRLDGTEPDEVTNTVRALAATFGDVGWFDADPPGLGTVVSAAVASLIGYEVDESGTGPGKPSPAPGTQGESAAAVARAYLLLVLDQLKAVDVRRTADVDAIRRAALVELLDADADRLMAAAVAAARQPDPEPS